MFFGNLEKLQGIVSWVKQEKKVQQRLVQKSFVLELLVKSERCIHKGKLKNSGNPNKNQIFMCDTEIYGTVLSL